ncbi:MAG TPA: cobyrinate a,c-diamide synthase, partial [Methylophaga sp.]|nr:cobyrinate a,c-diamide synthase [Methylophaga sp.]
MNQTHQCAAFVIAAPASGQGKTTVTATLARYYRKQGKRVRVFKVGPDFLDPMILQHASGNPVYQLDLWMVGEHQSRQLLADAAANADLILIEGVMGLFDGTPSTADLSATLNIPVIAVIDGSAMAQTFGALAYGLAHYRDDVVVAGVVANRTASQRHQAMLTDSLSDSLPWFAVLPRNADAALPSRHLGLVQAEEIADLEQRLTLLADHLVLNPDAILPVSDFIAEEKIALPRSLDKVKIAIAKDAAFSFIYQANLDLLQAMGAELTFFSPLNDQTLPEADCVYLPGGYPELYLNSLSKNTSMMNAIKQHYDANKPILAECGGMLYLTESITDKQGEQANMLGLIAGKTVMQSRFSALALQEVSLNNHLIRGHT